jgi:hypothetical protein
MAIIHGGRRTHLAAALTLLLLIGLLQHERRILLDLRRNHITNLKAWLSDAVHSYQPMSASYARKRVCA